MVPVLGDTEVSDGDAYVKTFFDDEAEYEEFCEPVVTTTTFTPCPAGN